MGSVANHRGAPSVPPYSSVPPALSPAYGDLARDMVERMVRSGLTSNAEALRELRAAFPESPLTVRVAALAMLMRRGTNNPLHIPR
jgi:hypothetical protein